MLEQYLRVRSAERDDDGLIEYVLYRDADDSGFTCFDLYTDDGRGNGTMICRGYNETRMRALALQLGEFVEWRAAD